MIPILFLAVAFLAPAHLSAETAPSNSPSNPTTLSEYVKQYYASTPVLAKIAECESHTRQYTDNGKKVYRGSINHYDIGVMQINALYHEKKASLLGMDIYTLSGNLQYAQHLYNAEGTQPWASSEACWGKLAKK
ncbi:MAG: hypothetical protein JO026_01655 [Patescibacteria group bacterium]|nr:hypothetical protein [Patescibacteria group bacterium]